MKKYVKPMILLERFELSQNIAVCAWDMNSAVGACTAVPDKDIFGDTMNGFLFGSGIGCDYDVEVMEDYCYQTGSGNLRGIFMS